MTPLYFNCDFCKNNFIVSSRRSIGRHKKYKNHFCSISCARKNFYSKLVTKIELECWTCKNKFTRLITDHKATKGQYCTKKCFYTARKKECSVEIICNGCGKKYSVVRHVLLNKKRSRSGKKYCSISCRAKNLNNNPYIEDYFEKMIPNNLKYNKNDRVVIAPLELDFFFKDKNIAVELNGKTHYEPVFGIDKLKKQKYNDYRKKKMCKQLNIKLISVKLGKCEIEKLKIKFTKILNYINYA